MEQTSEFSDNSGPRIFFFPALDSTNTYARAHFADLPDGSWVCAGTQTAGRGRENRRWLSPSGSNFYGTMVFKKLQDGFHAGLLIALAALRTIHESVPGIKAYFKWPNDVYVEDRKIAGTLCEGVTYANGRVTGAVAGIGINLNSGKSAFETLENPASSLFLESGIKIPVKKFQESLAKTAFRYYINYPGNLHDIFLQWKKANVLLGNELKLSAPDGKTYAGIFRDISDSGAMLLELAGGEMREFSCGDVRICRSSVNWKSLSFT